MKYFAILLYIVLSNQREQGPPPIDSPLYTKFEYYYDIYINETTLALPNLDPEYDTAQAVYISGNLQITMRELTLFFAKYWLFRHGIRVNGTNLETLSFLKPYTIHPLDDTTNSIEITNNPNLTTLGIDIDACTFCYDSLLIANNPKLDLKNDCDGIIKIYATNRAIYGNLFDCGCEIKGDFNKYVSTMSPKCWMLFGNVTIDKNSDLQVLEEKLKNVIKIYGGLSVTGTSFTNLSFLSSLELIFMDAYKNLELGSIVIKNNPNLVSLGMNAKRDGLYLTVRDNPNLCVTPQELDNLFYGLSPDSELDINICFNNQTPSHWCQLPESGIFTDLPDGCRNLIGDLVFTENFDFENSYKLYDIERLFGSLTIANSSLRKTSMLPNLHRIISIKDNKSPVYVSNNTRLTLFATAYWGAIESGQAATIIDNPNLIMYELLCDQMRTRKAAVIKNNLENCAETYSIKTVKYDSTPLNVDVYMGVPKFFDVSHGVEGPDDSGTWHNPWIPDEEDPDSPDDIDLPDEVEVTTGGCSCLIINLLIFTMILIF